MKADATLAGKLYDRGCKLGEAGACSALGRLYEGESPALGGHDLKSEADAFLVARRPAYETSCAKGEIGACEILGDFYHDGQAGVSVDEPRSKGYYHAACAGGSATACQKEIDPDWLAKKVRQTLERRAGDAAVQP